MTFIRYGSHGCCCNVDLHVLCGFLLLVRVLLWLFILNWLATPGIDACACQRALIRSVDI